MSVTLAKVGVNNKSELTKFIYKQALEFLLYAGESNV